MIKIFLLALFLIATGSIMAEPESDEKNSAEIKCFQTADRCFDIKETCKLYESNESGKSGVAQAWTSLHRTLTCVSHSGAHTLTEVKDPKYQPSIPFDLESPAGSSKELAMKLCEESLAKLYPQCD